MLDYDFCARQVARMGGLRYAPNSEEGLREVALFLEKAAVSEEHAERIISHYLDNEQDFPTPAGLKLYSAQVPSDPAYEKRLPGGCGECENGWRHYEKKVAPGGVEPYTADYCGFCSCPQGQWRKKAVRAYEAQQRAKQMASGGAE